MNRTVELINNGTDKACTETITLPLDNLLYMFFNVDEHNYQYHYLSIAFKGTYRKYGFSSYKEMTEKREEILLKCAKIHKKIISVTEIMYNQHTTRLLYLPLDTLVGVSKTKDNWYVWYMNSSNYAQQSAISERDYQHIIRLLNRE